MNNPYMDALTSGGQMANQGMNVANSMMQGVQKAMNSTSDLTYKLTDLLQKEEARKFEQGLQTTKLIQDQYQFGVKQQFQRDELKAREGQWDEQNSLGRDKLGLATDAFKLNKFKAVADLVGNMNAPKMDSKVYRNKLDTLEARASTIGKLSSEDFAGFGNESKEEALWEVNNEIKALQSAYSTQGQSSSSASPELMSMLTSAAKDAGIPLGTPTVSTPTVNPVPEGQPTAPSTLNTPGTGMVDTMNFGEVPSSMANLYAYDKAPTMATGDGSPQSPTGANPRIYEYNTIASTMAGEPAKMLQLQEKFVKPIVQDYKKMYPDNWATKVTNDPRVTNPAIAGLSSNSPKVVNATENDIRNMGMTQKQTETFMSSLEYKYDKQVAPTISYTNKGSDGGTWDYAKPANKAPLPSRWNTNTEHTLKYLEPEHLDALRQYALNGSEVSDAFMKAGSWLGITEDAFSTNTAFSHLAKQVGAKTMNAEGMSVISTAAWALENISNQAWGDDTQPFKFGSGIWSYSGVSERINDKNSITTSSGDKNPIYYYLIPEQIGGDIKVETSDMSPKARYKLYEQYKNGQKQMTDVKKEQYKHNALMITREINKYKEDNGYQKGDEFYADIDGMITTQIWNMHTNELEQVNMSVEKAGLMLGAMVAPMANMASH